jgi:hypothetical protein
MRSYAALGVQQMFILRVISATVPETSEVSYAMISTFSHILCCTMTAQDFNCPPRKAVKSHRICIIKAQTACIELRCSLT